MSLLRNADMPFIVTHWCFSQLTVPMLSRRYNARLQRELANNLALLLAGEEDLPWPPYGDRFVQSKRQIRYNQCYFNPISCFRKRK
ncbi:uncharacterized protein LOC143252545 isoform X2 [Tachypleus tridentatus]|uniref:uncharacterized protein LOC143252545 isoform X2 n=1 Tax=Tachypleus tridentatus TaxID=6853 RepID=UPI003FCF31C3